MESNKLKYKLSSILCIFLCVIIFISLLYGLFFNIYNNYAKDINKQNFEGQLKEVIAEVMDYRKFGLAIMQTVSNHYITDPNLKSEKSKLKMFSQISNLILTNLNIVSTAVYYNNYLYSVKGEYNAIFKKALEEKNMKLPVYQNNNYFTYTYWDGNNAVVFLLNNTWYCNRYFDNFNDQIFYCVDKNGNNIFSNTDIYYSKENSENLIFSKKYLDNNADTIKLKNSLHMIKRYIEEYDATFVAINKDNMTSGLNKMRNTILITIFLIFIIIAILVFIISKEFKTRIISLSGDVADIQNKFSNQKENLKKQLLISLVTETKVTDLNVEELVEFDLKINPNLKTTLLSIEINKFEQMKLSYSTEKIFLLWEKLIEDVNNTFNKFGVETFCCGDNDIICLINLNDDNEKSLVEYIENLRSVVCNYLSFGICVYIGGSSNNIAELNPLYSTARQLRKFKFIMGDGIIDFKDAENYSKTNYPILKFYEKEQTIIELMTRQNFSKAQEVFELAVEEFLQTGIKAEILLKKLIYAVCVEMQREKNTVSNFLNILIDELNISETIDDVHHIFNSIIHLLNNENAENVKNSDVIVKINNYIENNYSDFNLSLTKISDEMNLTPIYLGQLYKKTAGMSINDYVNNIRMEKAKDQLIQTNKVIIEIAKSVGIENKAHFYSQFKKKYGMSPGEYRKNIPENFI